MYTIKKALSDYKAEQGWIDKELELLSNVEASDAHDFRFSDEITPNKKFTLKDAKAIIDKRVNELETRGSGMSAEELSKYNY